MFLDITASNENRETIIEIVRKTAKECFVPLTVGGGVESFKYNDLLLAGADKVSINTAAVNNVNFLKEASKKFGSQCIVAAIDAKKVSDKWEVFTYGEEIKLVSMQRSLLKSRREWSRRNFINFNG